MCYKVQLRGGSNAAVIVPRVYMLARSIGMTIVGVRATAVDIEVDLARGLPGFAMVGLPGTAVRESRQRIRAAMINSDFDFPLRRITVNLAPAELRKEGTAFDLPIALAVLAAGGKVRGDGLTKVMCIGELALDGTVRPVRGALAAAIEAQRLGMSALVVPRDNAAEAAVAGLPVLAAESLRHAVELVAGLEKSTGGEVPPVMKMVYAPDCGDFRDVRGMPAVMRALEVAAAGRHHLLLVGAPGAGKTMIARRFPSILPPLDRQAALEASEIHSIAGLLPPGTAFVSHPPFRAPHSTVTAAGLFGGGRPVRPGEVTLAHHGVLFLDEYPEINSALREGLRAPMTDQRVSVSRVGAHQELPADFQLIAAANPCPCGFFGHHDEACRCPEHRRQAYQNKLSGPMADRIDMHLRINRIAANELVTAKEGTPSATMARRVAQARAVQKERLAPFGVTVNGRVPDNRLDEAIPLEPTVKATLVARAQATGLGPRSLQNVRRMARTVADLAQSQKITEDHINEAVLYRMADCPGAGQ